MLVDDHEVVRIGLKSLLSRHPGFEIVGEASTAGDAVRLAAEQRPDVVIMDVRLPGGSGVEACREICSARPEAKVIMLTSYADDEALFASILAGAKGYVLKQVGSQGLINAVETVARGDSLLEPAVTDRVLGYMRSLGASSRAGEVTLTPQERRILALIAEGKTNREIARQVYLSEKTVRNYVSSILSKMHFSNRTEAAAYALKKGLASSERI